MRNSQTKDNIEVPNHTETEVTMSEPVKKKLKVLVACEESQTVCMAFRELGHEAYSCDILHCSGGHPEWHIQGDAIKEAYSGKYDMMIAHPPCTYLSYVGNRHWNNPGRAEKRAEALEFFMALVNAPISKICVENPLGEPSRAYRKYDQIIHPYYFGDPFMKRTCLWLKNLPSLTWDKDAAVKPEPLFYLKTNGKAINWVEGIKGMSAAERQKARSVTYQGIADEMAKQWGNL